MLGFFFKSKKLKNKISLTQTDLLMCENLLKPQYTFTNFLVFIALQYDTVSAYVSQYRYKTRFEQTTNQKTKTDNITRVTAVNSVFELFIAGIRYLWVGLRYWFVALVLLVVIYYYMLYIRLISYNKFILEVLLLFMFTYWLMSGFVFFVKKYQYSKYTTALQRFWKRSFIIFWLLETFVFLVFLYLTLNSSEEPVYMYDQIKTYKTHLFSWRWFLIKLLPYVFLLFLGSYCLLSFKWGLFFKQSNYLFAITLVLIYIVWLEFYQFFHIINWYNNLIWVYDYEEFLWSIDIEMRRTRLVNNYAALCLMAKFWHLIFIFIFWVFFILRVNETSRFRLQLFNANLQNFLILYIMSWLYMYPWVKYILRKYTDYSYYWLLLNFRELGLKVFWYDLSALVYSFVECVNFLNIIGFKKEGLFYYWNHMLVNTNGFEFFKHNLYQLI